MRVEARIERRYGNDSAPNYPFLYSLMTPACKTLQGLAKFARDSVRRLIQIDWRSLAMLITSQVSL